MCVLVFWKYQFASVTKVSYYTGTAKNENHYLISGYQNDQNIVM